ncbi:MAG: S-methyl-5-thioribose-1-phosphate isomerase, partial [Thermoproteota archaeon]
GYMFEKDMIDLVIIGADRITKNGDVVNKIGSYEIAVLAKHHNIPFYVAAPYTTFDPNIEKGADVTIEERVPHEVTEIAGVKIAPDGIKVFNPVFDIVPHELITGYITERGVITKFT